MRISDWSSDVCSSDRDPVALRLPALGGTIETEVLDRAHTTVEGHPGHELRMREVPGRAANLPDALVGQAPLLLEVLQQHLLKIPALVGRLQQELAADVQGIEHRSEEHTSELQSLMRTSY